MDTGIVLISLSRDATLTGVNLMNILPVLSFPEFAFRIFSPRPRPLDLRVLLGPRAYDTRSDFGRITDRLPQNEAPEIHHGVRQQIPKKLFSKVVSCAFSQTYGGWNS